MSTAEKPVTRSFIEAARRAQIMSCAIEVIAELGYTSASLAQIARRAGISKGVISYHFAGKEELVREVAKHVFTLGAQHMGPRIEAQTTPRRKLRAYIESNLEFMNLYKKELLALVSILIYARTSKGEMLFDLRADEEVLRRTERIFVDGQKRGDFRKFSPRAMAIALRGAIDAAPGKLLANPDFDLAAYAREMADFFDFGTAKVKR